MEINATLIIQLALFLTLLAFLSRVLFAPLQRLEDERERRIEGPKAEAKDMLQRGQTKANYIEEELAKGSKAAREEFLSHREAGLAIYRQAMEAAKEQARIDIETARKDVAQSLAKARTGLGGDVKTLSALAFDKVMGAPVKGHQGSINGTGNGSSNEEESHA
jgi:F-type H+-transporting ATPase subunit b